MAASSGVTIGHGTTVRLGRISSGGGGTVAFTALFGVEEAQFPDQTPDDVDVTHLGSPNGTEETIPGLKKVATLSMPIQYAPGKPTDTLLVELDETDPKEDVILEITPKGGTPHQWYAYLNSWRPTGLNAKDKMMGEAIWKVKARISPIITGVIP